MFAYISAAAAVWISVKFDIGVFYENLSEKSKFGYNQAKLLGTLCEDLNTFHCFSDSELL